MVGRTGDASPVSPVVATPLVLIDAFDETGVRYGQLSMSPGGLHSEDRNGRYLTRFRVWVPGLYVSG